MKRNLLLLTAILGSIPFSHASSIIRLGGLHTDISSMALGISPDGRVVVGQSRNTNDNTEAFRWTAEAGMAGLGDFAGGAFQSTAYAVSAGGGVVVGCGMVEGNLAFRWTPTNSMTSLDDLSGTALAVSSSGTVIAGQTAGYQAYRWTQTGGMVSLGDVADGERGAYGVSADGSVVVGYGVTTNGFEACRWTNDTVEFLGDLPGGEVDSWANGVSADGRVVVGGGRATNGYEAFRWTRATGMVSLGLLPGFDTGEATAASADGNVIVGFCYDQFSGQQTTSFVWTPERGVRGLAEVLAERGADLSQWQFLSQAKGVSADGRWVCGYGWTTNNTEEAFLADLGPVVTLQPVDDAYLSNGSEADQNWNTTALEQFGYYASIKRPLLKFDLSSIPDGATVLSAQLTLQRAGHYGGDGYFSALSRMTNDNWFETNVTWNSYNQTGAVVVATLPHDHHDNLKTWNVNLAAWAYAEDLLDDNVTFMLRWDQDIYGGYETDGVYKWNTYISKEGTVSPTLRIEYTTAPAAPQLAIVRSNNAVIVSWPLPADGWVLEATNALPRAAAPWPQIAPPYQTNGPNLQFTEPSPVGNQFYRLHKP